MATAIWFDRLKNHIVIYADDIDAQAVITIDGGAYNTASSDFDEIDGGDENNSDPILIDAIGL